MGERKKTKLVCGVGVNDAISPVTWYVTVNNSRKQKMCPFYSTWKSMIRRCYDENYTTKTYRDCTVCDDWLLFSNFKVWMEQQKWEGLHLDKDLLGKDSKIYSPDTCVFVPNEINAQAKTNSKSNYSGFLGVVTEKRYKNFKYRTCISGKTFKSPVEAHRAWQWERSGQVEGITEWYGKQSYFRTDVAEALSAKVWKLRLEYIMNIITEEV